jgi:hypothetical protein
MEGLLSFSYMELVIVKGPLPKAAASPHLDEKMAGGK